MESEIAKDLENTPEAKEKLVKVIIDTIIDNISSSRMDYEKFLRDCVDHFEDFMYGKDEVKTVDDFLKLPSEAVHKIAKTSIPTQERKISFLSRKKNPRYRVSPLSDGLPEDRER
jgi:hypothetical protein